MNEEGLEEKDEEEQELKLVNNEEEHISELYVQNQPMKSEAIPTNESDLG